MRQSRARDNTYFTTSGDADFIRLFEMKTMLESITDGFFAVNANWVFTYINSESEKFLGKQIDELLGNSMWDSLPYLHESKFHKELYKASAQQISVHFEHHVIEKNKWYEVNAYPLRDGLAIYFKDITEEKEYLNRIEERNKLLTDIAWIQAHKIRGPVANILGLSKLFNYDNSSDPGNKEILDNIKVAIQDLDNVIKEVVQKTNLTINS